MNWFNLIVLGVLELQLCSFEWSAVGDSSGILSFGAFGPVIFGTCFTQLLWPGGDTHVQVGQSFHLIRMSPK